MTNDPLHRPGSPDAFWTTINAEENLAGVTDPLSADFWIPAVTLGALGAFADMGVLSPKDVVYSDDVDANFTSVISGRYCVNIDLLRKLADAMPGTSGEALERDLFGSARAGVPSQPNFSRYPIVAVKAPRAVGGVARRMHRDRGRSQRWWTQSIGALRTEDPATARYLLDAGQQHMAAMIRDHNLATMIVQGVLEQVRGLVVSIERPELELELTRGLDSLEEVGMVGRLWDLSRGRGDVAGFVGEFGYHGPDESNLNSVVWRENPAAVASLAERYASMDDSRSPVAAAAAVAALRRSAAAELLAGLPAHRRPLAKGLLAFCGRLMALREVGKASYLQGIDVGRAAVRILGRDLAAQGRLDAPDDVRYLVVSELTAASGPDLRESVAFRRARREEYLSFDVGQTWTGEPERQPRAVALADTTELHGIAASPGVVEGTVRIVLDPDDADLEDGDVLVCKTTDPSWGTLFLMVAAIVIDVGAPSSHGAIVARELGVPCVINTRTGTRSLRDGDRVSVNGTAGVVQVLERAAPPTIGG